MDKDNHFYLTMKIMHVLEAENLVVSVLTFLHNSFTGFKLVCSRLKELPPRVKCWGDLVIS